MAMDEAYIEEVVESGERLPDEMWEPSISETMPQSPVFDGSNIVDEDNEGE